jgi:hypothetical protein
MRDWRDYYKSRRCHNYQVRCYDLDLKMASLHYYTNTLHWRLREWHQAPKLYSN